MRRVYLPQYAAAPIVNSQTGEQLNPAVPFVNDGKSIYNHSADTAENWGGSPPPSLAT